MKQKYRFFFQDMDAAGRPTTELKYDVDGWAGYGVNFGREENISNVVKSYTDDFVFIKEDARYLRGKLRISPNRRVRLIIKKLTDALRETYENEFVGYIDFTQAKWVGNTFTAPVNEAGFFKALENKWGTDFEFETDEIVRIDGGIFTDVVKFEKTDKKDSKEQIPNLHDSQNNELSRGCAYLLGGNIVDEESDEKKLSFCNNVNTAMVYNVMSHYGAFEMQAGSPSHKINKSDAIFSIGSGVEMKGLKVSYNIGGRLFVSSGYTGTSYNTYTAVRIMHAWVDDGDFIQTNPNDDEGTVISSSSIVLDDYVLVHANKGTGREGDWDGDQMDIKYELNGEIDIGSENGGLKGKSLFLFLVVEFDQERGLIYVGNSEVNMFEFTKYDMTFSYDAQINRDKHVSAIGVGTLFERLISKINEGKYNVVVDNDSFVSLTDGVLTASNSSLRGSFRISDNWFTIGKVTTSLENFLKFAYAVYGYQLGVDYDKDTDAYRVFLEHFNNFYSQPKISDLKLVNGVSYSIKRDLLYTKIRVGYQNDAGNIYNGMKEFNNEQVWTTPNTEIEENELDITSSYNASSKNIETIVYDYYNNFENGNKDHSGNYLIASEFSRKIDNTEIPNFNRGRWRSIVDRKWDDLVVVNNNPLYNSGFVFDRYMWFKDGDYTQIIGDAQYIQRDRDEIAVSYYTCLAYDTVTDRWILLYYNAFNDTYSLPREDFIYIMENYLTEYSFNDVSSVRYSTLRRRITIIGGCSYPEYEWNVEFSPRRTIDAHSTEIDSYMAFERGKEIERNTCELNGDMVAGGLVESSPKEIGSSPLFYPVSINVTAIAKEGLIGQIERRRCGYFSFEYDGNNISGFIAKNGSAITINPMQEKASEFELIAKWIDGII